MQSRLLELLFGLFFCLGVAAVFLMTFKVASVEGVTGPAYDVTATFENIGGLKPGAAVTLAGVKIGRVQSIVIDRQSFNAVVHIQISSSYDNIPSDSAAKILTAGLLGEQYIGLDPGGADSSLKQGDKIAMTQSALVLENLIGQFVAGKAQSSANEAPAPAAAH